MNNFIIDTSVFALPKESPVSEIEKKNLVTLKENILRLEQLRRAARNTATTVSYMKDIPYLLFKSHYPNNERQIKSRIAKLDCKELGFDGPVLENWEEIIKEISSKQDEMGVWRKGRLGIFKNIPDRSNGPGEEYLIKAKLTENGCIYPNLTNKLKNTFKRYCSYIGELNYKYNSSYSNFIVIGEECATEEVKEIAVVLGTKDCSIQSFVSVVGIQKTNTLPRTELEFKSLLASYEKAKQNFSSKLIFGREVKKENIEKNLYRDAGPPAKLYHYLETLYYVAGIIDGRNIHFGETSNFNLVEMLNAHGLLCSPDTDKYTKFKCKHRKFENESGKKLLFSIHLKPSTYGNSESVGTKGTVRIYLDWDNENKKFCIGWIGHHPVSCEDCSERNCPAQLYKKK
jgi:hypothetical protein